MEKKEIRHSLIQKRENMPSHLWNTNSRAIQKKILTSKIFKEADKVLLYSDIKNEVETLTLIEESLIEGKEIYLPKVLESFDEASMEFYRVDSSFSLVDGYMGIKEPVSSESKRFKYEEHENEKILMLVPGVAFDKNGNRLGYGKGYYDTYLSDKPSILTIGICFSLQVVDELPHEENDQILDYLINELTDTDEIKSFEYKN